MAGIVPQLMLAERLKTEGFLLGLAHHCLLLLQLDVAWSKWGEGGGSSEFLARDAADNRRHEGGGGGGLITT